MQNTAGSLSRSRRSAGDIGPLASTTKRLAPVSCTTAHRAQQSRSSSRRPTSAAGQLGPPGLLEDRRGAIEHARAASPPAARRGRPVAAHSSTRRGASATGRFRVERDQALRAILERFGLQLEAAERQHVGDAVVQLRLQTQRRVGGVLPGPHGHASGLGERPALREHLGQDRAADRSASPLSVGTGNAASAASHCAWHS